ncbi:MAG: PEP-CTERM sorting domain-containing protein [Gammaproteobacteria bacterium]|nr:PEP-CTERM sorting domain-containing protein [Gammaproteobacteria bacterium]NNF66352.1 PEP-CTERM sorting domain-containing protein [Gammaproteobacteria bacterium]
MTSKVLKAVGQLAMFAALSAFLLSSTASAAIVKFQQAKSCQVDGLDGPDDVQGGVHCDGDNPFSLTDILNGSIALWVGDSQTPSWNIINDTGQALDSVTFFYFGALASNAFIDMQTSGTDVFSACTATTADGVVTSDDNCGSDDKTSDDPALALMMEWSGGTGLGVNEVFNLGTASFAHSGQDAGCFSGTANCGPNSTVTVPEPLTLGLLGAGLIILRLSRRRAAVKTID